MLVSPVSLPIKAPLASKGISMDISKFGSLSKASWYEPRKASIEGVNLSEFSLIICSASC